MKFFRSAHERQRIDSAEATFREIIGGLSAADPWKARLLAQRLAGEEFAAIAPRDRRRLGEQAFLHYANNALADDHLTQDEEDALSAVAGAIAFTQDDLVNHDLYTRLTVAKINNGRLPIVDAPQILAKRGEVVHLETAAALTKEVTVREWRGGSQGVSFRIAKGVRYHVGQTRGHMVTVGTQIQVADTGYLAVTNQRAAYIGSRKTVEMPYKKIIGLQLYTDGLGFSLSNRQSSVLVKVTINADVLGALLNAAMQSSL